MSRGVGGSVSNADALKEPGNKRVRKSDAINS